MRSQCHHRFGRKTKTALYKLSAKQTSRVHTLTIMSVATALSHVFFTIPGKVVRPRSPAIQHVAPHVPRFNYAGNVTYLMYVTYPDELNDWQDITTSLFFALTAMNHSKNFILYNLTSSDMRQASREFICSMFRALMVGLGQQRGFKGGPRGDRECCNDHSPARTLTTSAGTPTT